MIYDKARALEPGYYELFEMTYKPALEKDRKDAERYRWLRDHGGARYQDTASSPEGFKACIVLRVPSCNSSGTYQLMGTAADEAVDAEILRTTKPLLVAPPATKGKAKSSWYRRTNEQQEELRVHKERLNQVADDYDLTSNDTRRGD